MIAIYARQSADRKDSISIEAQIQAGKKVAGDTPLTIYDQDRGYSGKNTDRPDFQRLVGDIKSGLITRVIVYKLDRISRSVVDFADIMKLFEQYKVEFVSVTESFDTSNPMGRAMLYIIMTFAQLERETIQERVRSNFYERMKLGIGKSGRPPFGFVKMPATILGKNTKILHPKEDEAQLVRQIYDIYANSDITLHKLKHKLTEESTLKPFFTDVFLNLLLRNPIYVKASADVYHYLKSKNAIIENNIEDFVGVNGCFAYANAKERTHQRFTDLSKTHIALQPHEGLIEPDIWLKCNHRLDKNKAFKNSGSSSYTWLSGLMECAYCGYAAYAATSGSPYNHIYLNCRGRKKHICFERTTVYRINTLEESIEQMLLDYLKQRSNSKISQKKKDDNRKLNLLKIELGVVNEKIENLINSIAEGGDILAKYVGEKINELDRESARITTEISKEIMNNKDEDKLPAIDREFILRNWHTFDIEHKKSVAKTLIRKIIISNESIDVDFF